MKIWFSDKIILTRLAHKFGDKYQDTEKTQFNFVWVLKRKQRRRLSTRFIDSTEESAEKQTRAFLLAPIYPQNLIFFWVNLILKISTFISNWEPSSCRPNLFPSSPNWTWHGDWKPKVWLDPLQARRRFSFIFSATLRSKSCVPQSPPGTLDSRESYAPYQCSASASCPIQTLGPGQTVA